MTVPFDAGRRRLLLAILGLTASAAIGPRAIASVLERLGAADATTRALRSLILSRDSAVRLGRAYLVATPNEASASRLTSLILGESAMRTGREAARVRSRIQGDFDAGRVVTVDGWIVSPTEARLCALCALV